MLHCCLYVSLSCVVFLLCCVLLVCVRFMVYIFEGGSAGVAPADLEGSRPAPRVRGRGETLPRGSCPVGYEDAFLGGWEASLPLRRVGDELPGFIVDCRVQPVLLLLAQQRFQQRPETAAINRLPGVCLACRAQHHAATARVAPRCHGTRGPGPRRACTHVSAAGRP